MRKYILIVGILVILVGGVWLYSVLKGRASTGSAQEVITDKGFSVSQDGKTISQAYIADATNLNFGISVYPKAKLIDEKGAASNMEINGSKILTATYQTTDSREKVEKFYMSQIGSEAIFVEAVDGAITYKLIKSKTNIGPSINIYVRQNTTYFTILSPVS